MEGGDTAERLAEAPPSAAPLRGGRSAVGGVTRRHPVSHGRQGSGAHAGRCHPRRPRQPRTVGRLAAPTPAARVDASRRVGRAHACTAPRRGHQTL